MGLPAKELCLYGYRGFESLPLRKIKVQLFIYGSKSFLLLQSIFSGYSVARLSRLLWEQEVAGSNPATPTLFSTKIDDFWSNLLITNFPTKNFKIISKDNFLALFNRCRLQKKSKTEQKTEQKNICGIFNFKNAKLLHVYFVLLKIIY